MRPPIVRRDFEITGRDWSTDLYGTFETLVMFILVYLFIILEIYNIKTSCKLTYLINVPQHLMVLP